MTADLAETRRRLDDLIRFAGEVHEAATAARDAMDANEPFIVPEPIDLSARLAGYGTATEDVPRDVVCAVLETAVRPDLSVVLPLFRDLRNELVLARDSQGTPHEMALSNANSILSQLCDLMRTEGVWPQQPARTRERIYEGGRNSD